MGVFRFVDKIIKGSEYPWRYGFFNFDRRIINPLKKPWGFKYLFELIKTITTQSDWQEGTLTDVVADTDALVLEEQYALEFDGVDDYVGISHVSNDIVMDGRPMTVEFWIKPYNEGSDFGRIVSQGTLTEQSFSVRYDRRDGNIYVAFEVGVFSQGDSGADSVPLNQWAHVAVVWEEDGTIRYFIDGAQTATNSNTDSLSGGDLTYIANRVDGDAFFAGIVDDVRMWNTARTQQEIQDNMNKRLSGSETGLVGYWPMDEGSGTTVYDESTNNNDGEIEGATWTSGYIFGTRTSPPLSLDDIKNVASSEISWTSTEPTDTDIKIECAVTDYAERYALEFDGDGDYVNCGNDSSLQITKDQTYEFWYKPLSVDDIRRNPINKAYGGEGTITEEDDMDDEWMTYYYGEAGEDSSPYQGFDTNIKLGEVNKGQWYHIALVRDLDNMKLYWYINGELDAEADAEYSEATSSDYDLLLGDGYQDNLHGMLDEVRIWNTARTQQEIQDNMDKTLTGDEEGLVAYYPMNEGEGTTVYDESTNNNDGTIHGATWIEKEPFDEDYTEATSGEAIPGISAGDDLTGKYLWVRQTLSTSDPDTTPELDELKIEVYYI